MSKPKPWSMTMGGAIGLPIGGFLWWSSYETGAGLLQNPQLIIGPVAFGILVAALRNRQKKVGPWDPETIALNRQGRV